MVPLTGVNIYLRLLIFLVSYKCQVVSLIGNITRGKKYKIRSVLCIYLRLCGLSSYFYLSTHYHSWVLSSPGCDLFNAFESQKNKNTFVFAFVYSPIILQWVMGLTHSMRLPRLFHWPSFFSQVSKQFFILCAQIRRHLSISKPISSHKEKSIIRNGGSNARTSRLGLARLTTRLSLYIWVRFQSAFYSFLL